MKERKFCARCGLSTDTKDYIQVKTISCPTCGEPAIRSKAIYRASRYRASRSEHFYCTNTNCRVRIIIITQREKQLQMELPKQSDIMK